MISAEGYGRHRVAVKRPSRRSPPGTRASHRGSRSLRRGGVGNGREISTSGRWLTRLEGHLIYQEAR
ncbi:hypothetical protein AV530_018241 [Patagioenas fasciata monilis]|uniref:Uncharacterized protein n=1 Tax=Patagioenas fasciata monilis TaxID=372326 RepID=A0A1V4JRA5_PATFA|nr:hypothetical protein AV530_018241 [Patagioenas fasciata monilis]